jgi:glycerate kinase
MADGGEGTSLVLLGAGARSLPGVLVLGPDGDRVSAPVLDLDGVTFVESARILGLGVVRGQSSPLDRTSWGLGEALTLAGINREGPLVVGLGGSATVDGGIGMAQALGLHPEDIQGQHIENAGARDLSRIARLRGDPPLAFQIVQAWADVRTSLAESCRVFGPQKGVRPDQMDPLTDGLKNWAAVLNRWRQDLHQREIDPEIPGGGAAGGLGYALMALLDARLVPGSQAVARAIGLSRTLRHAQAVVTGEGCYDQTSLHGKVVGEVLRLSRMAGVAQVGVLAGRVENAIAQDGAGPDWVIACGPGDRQGRHDRLIHAASQVAQRLLPG